MLACKNGSGAAVEDAIWDTSGSARSASALLVPYIVWIVGCKC